MNLPTPSPSVRHALPTPTRQPGSSRWVVITFTVIGALLLTACSTWRGAGDDIEKTGRSMK